MSNVALIAELDRLHHRATDLRAREAQLADAGENDPASDTWKTAAIVAASAECEFHAALVAAWPTISRVLREAAEGGWRPIPGPTLDRVFVAGWQPQNGTVRGYWWFYEDLTDEHGRPMEHSDATMWRPLPPPPSPETATHSLEPRNDDR